MSLAPVARTTHPLRSRGFTLLDVLTTAAIVACLSAIALPSYHRTILKDRRTIARTALMDLAARQETHRLAHGAFATDVGTLVAPFDVAPTAIRYLGSGGTWLDQPARDSLFRVELLDADSASTAGVCGAGDVDAPGAPVALSAVAIGPQADDRSCHRLVLCFAGRPGARTAFDDAERSTPAIRDVCWGIRGG